MRLLSTACLKWERGPSRRLNLFFLVQIPSIIEAVGNHSDPLPGRCEPGILFKNFSRSFIVFKSFCSVLNSQHTPLFLPSVHRCLLPLFYHLSMGTKVLVKTPWFLESVFPKAGRGLFLSWSFLTQQRERYCWRTLQT